VDGIGRPAVVAHARLHDLTQITRATVGHRQRTRVDRRVRSKQVHLGELVDTAVSVALWVCVCVLRACVALRALRACAPCECGSYVSVGRM
jgi:hypothetical protein